MILRTVEAEIDGQGRVRLLEPISLAGACRALVVILEPVATSAVTETALLSEPALAEDWSRPEEDAAWSHLEQGPSS
jgi:hypothetical protein